VIACTNYHFPLAQLIALGIVMLTIVLIILIIALVGAKHPWWNDR
jgi:hypothetical protein